MVYSVENFHIFWNTNAEVLRLLINAASGRLVQEKNHLKEHKISDILVFRTSIIFVLTSYYKYDDFQKSILSSEGPDVLCTIFYREFLFCCEEDCFFFSCHELQRIVLFKCLHTNYVSDQSNTSYIRSRWSINPRRWRREKLRRVQRLYVQ